MYQKLQRSTELTMRCDNIKTTFFDHKIVYFFVTLVLVQHLLQFYQTVPHFFILVSIVKKNIEL